MSLNGRVASWVTAAVAVPLLVGSMLVFHPTAGTRAEIILSDSMKPAFSAGSLVVIHNQPPWHYKVGDIVTFLPPIKNAESVTHRITKVYDSGGVLVMQTRGDSNRSVDPWITGLGAVTGKEIFFIPWIGYPIHVIKTPIGFALIITLSFLLLVWRELCSLIIFIRLSLTSRNATSP